MFRGKQKKLNLIKSISFQGLKIAFSSRQATPRPLPKIVREKKFGNLDAITVDTLAKSPMEDVARKGHLLFQKLNGMLFVGCVGEQTQFLQMEPPRAAERVSTSQLPVIIEALMAARDEIALQQKTKVLARYRLPYPIPQIQQAARKLFAKAFLENHYAQYQSLITEMEAASRAATLNFLCEPARKVFEKTFG